MKKKPAVRKSSSGVSRGPWFVAGLACGVFLSFLTWLAAQQPANQELETANVEAEQTPSQGPEFKFYEVLREQTIEVDVDPAEIARARVAEDNDRYLLQAGSFRQPEDAERRRARLILLGLEPEIKPSDGGNGRWYRVFIGPFESRSKLNRARSLTAQDGIETLMLKRPDN